MGLANAILDQSIRRLNELSTTSPIRWTRAELMVFFNDAMDELNLIAADYQTTDPVAINNTSNVWSLPTSVIGPFSVRVGNYLIREHLEDLDKDSQWEDPMVARMNPKTWSSLGLSKIIITPRPTVAAIAYVEGLSQYSVVPDAAVDMISWIRPEYERSIEDFIISRAMFKEGGAEFQQAMVFYNRFLDTVQQLSGRNVIRRYPSWDVTETKLSETTLREGADSAQ